MCCHHLHCELSSALQEADGQQQQGRKFGGCSSAPLPSNCTLCPVFGRLLSSNLDFRDRDIEGVNAFGNHGAASVEERLPKRKVHATLQTQTIWTVFINASLIPPPVFSLTFPLSKRGQSCIKCSDCFDFYGTLDGLGACLTRYIKYQFQLPV